MVNTVKEALIAARWILERYWGQRAYARTEDGKALPYGSCAPNIKSVCALGAIGLVETPGYIRGKAAALLHDELGDIARWNDAPERTKEDVLALYDKAITKAEENEQ